MHDIGAENLITAIVQQACKDYYYYRRACYRYNGLQMHEESYCDNRGRLLTRYVFDAETPPGYTKSQFDAKLARLKRLGEDAETFLSNKNGWLETLMPDMGSGWLMRKLDEKAKGDA